MKRLGMIVAVTLALAVVAFGEPKDNLMFKHGHGNYGSQGQSVPEPGSLLVFGTGLLLSAKALSRKWTKS
jgi:hypothetical protein